MSTTVEQIKERLAISDVISEYVRLKRAGTNFKALCPFHTEKTPSFIVSPEKGMWHCFGCSEGGDLFTFIEKMEGVDFAEALRILAKRAGVEIHYDRREEVSRDTKTRLSMLLALAEKFYAVILWKGKSGPRVLAYLHGRGFSDETLKIFGIGFAPDAWDGLTTFLTARGFTVQEIIAAGLAVANDRGGAYDRFRSRVIFPIHDQHGQLVAFGGRIMPDEKGETPVETAKYINSPETLLYQKGRLLYNLERAKTDIRKTGHAIVMEGYTDVMASVQAGVPEAVASLGTALTEDQLRLLSRYTNHLILGYDADLAGDTATTRGIHLALQFGFTLSVLSLPQGDDPADVAVRSPEEWRKITVDHQHVLDFAIASALRRHGTASGAAKRNVVDEVLRLLIHLPSAVEQAHYLNLLATELAIPEQALYDEVKKGTRTRVETKEEVSPRHAAIDTQAKVEEEILLLLINFPSLTRSDLTLSPNAFLREKPHLLYTAFCNHELLKANETVPWEEVVPALSQAAREYYEILLLNREAYQLDSEKAQREAYQEALRKLRKLNRQEELTRIKEELRQAEHERNLGKVEALSKELAGVIKGE